MYASVTSVSVLDDYRLLLEFDHRERRVFDVKPLFGLGRFRDLASLAEFRSAHVSIDTVAWSNGLDLDPEYLYERSEPAAPDPGAGPGVEARE
jgi:hypothetical protein